MAVTRSRAYRSCRCLMCRILHQVMLAMARGLIVKTRGACLGFLRTRKRHPYPRLFECRVGSTEFYIVPQDLREGGGQTYPLRVPLAGISGWPRRPEDSIREAGLGHRLLPSIHSRYPRGGGAEERCRSSIRRRSSSSSSMNIFSVDSKAKHLRGPAFGAGGRRSRRAAGGSRGHPT
ncbi:hypothetical protein LY76DRAFT_358283 [Colletotrichum caudatum]|nr:hypothetical protein LY76DRAFT_358283 [Colletotrichum caudatum]